MHEINKSRQNAKTVNFISFKLENKKVIVPIKVNILCHWIIHGFQKEEDEEKDKWIIKNMILHKNSITSRLRLITDAGSMVTIFTKTSLCYNGS